MEQKKRMIEKRASLTVEAALVLPLFLFAMILTGYLAQMARCQDEVQWALTRIAREASAEYGATEKKAAASRAYYLLKMNRYMEGSGLSVSFLESSFNDETDEIDLIANYRMKLPVRFLPESLFLFRARVHTRAFTGVESRLEGLQDGMDREVYITKSGRVYHDSLSCTYLKLSISQLKFSDLENMRNEGGGKYKPCGKCCKMFSPSPDTDIWITNYGDKYHSSRSCSGIKRYIRTIRRSEAGERTPCSKCGKP